MEYKASTWENFSLPEVHHLSDTSFEYMKNLFPVYSYKCVVHDTKYKQTS